MSFGRDKPHPNYTPWLTHKAIGERIKDTSFQESMGYLKKERQYRQIFQKSKVALSGS
jgi:hypothetical protein